MVAHWDLAAQSSLLDLALAFIVALRFDIATTFIFAGIIPLILLLPFPKLYFRRNLILWTGLVIFLNIIAITPNVIDIAYFRITNRRLSYEFFVMLKDIIGFAWVAIVDYWFLLAAGLLVVGLFTWLIFRIGKSYPILPIEPYSGKSFGIGFAIWLFWIGILIVGIRGGLQLKPLRPAMAFFSTDRFAGNLASNSAYTVISSTAGSGGNTVEFLPKDEAISIVRNLIRNSFDTEWANSEYPFLRKAQFQEPEKKLNVVILIMESLNASQVGCLQNLPLEQSLTPNFDTLAKNGLLFTNFYANAVRSIEAVPAIYNSLPDVLPHSIIASDFETNTTYGLGNILHDKGWTTSFFHGADNGTMGYHAYTRLSGVNHYYGINEYPGGKNSPDYDGTWGIFDGPYLQYFANQLSKQKQPFFSVVFTLSNHHPYRLPTIGAESIQNLPLTPNQKTFRYSDLALGQFFQTASQMPWFSNTIFLITGDHTWGLDANPDETVVDKHHVPLLIYAPGKIKPRVSNAPGCHTHILPTVIDLLKLSTWYAATVPSLADSTQKSLAFFQHSGTFTLLKDSIAYSSNLEDLNLFEEWSGRKKRYSAESPEILAISMERKKELRAYYQVLQNAIVQNKLVSINKISPLSK
ncbi:MAG: LTA synthase family protein [Bacteroidia bacterium]|nr:LTA synthase family protein [Bacteroidia bacterium]